MILFILFCVSVLFLIYSLANFFKELSLAEKIIAYYLLMAADILLLLEISSLLHVLNSPIYVISIQLLFIIIALFVNKLFQLGFPLVNKDRFRSAIADFKKSIKNHKSLSIFILFIALNYLFLAFLSIYFPQNTSDSLYNHLSRIGFWLQQGSLQKYTSFNMVGIIYPYNNSLLMFPSILFLKTDKLVGLTQFFAALVAFLAIYLLGKGIGYGKKSSLISALIFLTYPIVIYESITAQNDLLVTTFICAAFLFLIVKPHDLRYLILSVLSLGIAFGVKQYTAYVLPGYVIIFFYLFLRDKKKLARQTLPGILSLFICVLLFGSYTYIQNLVDYQNPLGPQSTQEKLTGYSAPDQQLPKLATNSSRLFAQFISCDGLSPNLAKGCLDLKGKVLRPLLAKNIDSTDFLYDKERFTLTSPDVYDAESAWFGFISWVILLPAIITGLIVSIKKRNFINLTLIGTSIFFYIAIILTKSGWDPYQGRYLIAAVALVQPFTAGIFDLKSFLGKGIKVIICVLSLLIMIYSTLNNASLPVVSLKQFKNIEIWGMDHSLFIQKVAYKAKPYLMYQKDVWTMDTVQIKTLSDKNYYPAVNMVNANVPQNSSLGIATNNLMFFDYLFRGNTVQRPLFPITMANNSEVQFQPDYILLSPDFYDQTVAGYHLIQENDRWQLLKRTD